MVELMEKINFEKEEYFNYLRLNSRSALIDKAWEIAAKKALYDKLINEFNDLPDNLKSKMELTDDIVDYIFLKAKDDIELINGNLTSFSWTKIINNIFL